MKKTITIALLATMSVMMVAGLASNQLMPQAHAAASAASLSLPGIGDAAGASAGQTRSGSGSGLINVCPEGTFNLLGVCSDAS
jgi:hypothetical protein